jgi:hypothetical protein
MTNYSVIGTPAPELIWWNHIQMLLLLLLQLLLLPP